jgi:hypothetical protein
VDRIRANSPLPVAALHFYVADLSASSVNHARDLPFCIYTMFEIVLAKEML